MMYSRKESLDTNIILRMMLNDVPSQREAVIELLCNPDVEYYIADLAITEAVYVLQSKGKTRLEIVAYLESLFKRINLRVNYQLFERVFPMYVKHHKLSFNDCCLAAYAELEERRPLWTFDQALAKEVEVVQMVA